MDQSLVLLAANVMVKCHNGRDMQQASNRAQQDWTLQKEQDVKCIHVYGFFAALYIFVSLFKSLRRHQIKKLTFELQYITAADVEPLKPCRGIYLGPFVLPRCS